VCAALVAATFLPLIPTDDWWIRVLDFPRPQIAALLAVAAPAAWALLDRRRAATRVLLAGILVALGLQLHRIWLYTPLHPVQAAPAGEACAPEHRLSVLTANLREGNSGAGPFLEEVRRADPDLVLVVEVDRQWIAALRPLEERYPHRLLHPRDDF